LLLSGQIEAAQAQLEEALRIADELTERVYLPQLLLLDAAIARTQGRADDGSKACRRALEEARLQAAPWLELLALVDLCTHHVHSEDDLRTLRSLVQSLPEARDAQAVRTARALLAHEVRD
jgi:hypothetical protein